MASRTLSTSAQTTNDSSLDTSIAIPNTGSIATIDAGSLVVAFFRYENGSGGTITSVADSSGASGYIIKSYSTQPRVDIAYKHNHPGGSNVVITGTLSATMAYREGYVGVWTGTIGESDPIDGTESTIDGVDPSINKTVTGDGIIVMLSGSFSSGTPYVATSPAAILNTQRSYSAALWRSHTGSGSKTIAATGGAGTVHSLAVAFLDPVSASTVAPKSIQQFRQRRI